MTTLDQLKLIVAKLEEALNLNNYWITTNFCINPEVCSILEELKLTYTANNHSGAWQTTIFFA